MTTPMQTRLRTCAKHTGLDAVAELLNGAADEIDALQARAQVQGEPSWWMRETDEGAEWADTAPLVLSGWTTLYTHPAPNVPADVVRDAISTVREHYRGTNWGKAAESICDAIDAMLAAK